MKILGYEMVYSISGILTANILIYRYTENDKDVPTWNKMQF